jgi:hypothetical protein
LCAGNGFSSIGISCLNEELWDLGCLTGTSLPNQDESLILSHEGDEFVFGVEGGEFFSAFEDFVIIYGVLFAGKEVHIGLDFLFECFI